MKLKMHSFDFEECTLTFSVPKEVMHSNGFGNVPGGVEVDLVAITKNAALGAVETKPEQTHNSKSMPCCDVCGGPLRSDGDCSSRIAHLYGE